MAPREKTVGRFRLISQAGGNYGQASPFLGRSRFSVIPEEPHGSPVLQGTATTEKEPTPEWDFDDDKKVIIFRTNSLYRSMYPQKVYKFKKLTKKDKHLPTLLFGAIHKINLPTEIHFYEPLCLRDLERDINYN